MEKAMIILDKPAGITSFKITNRVRRKLKVEKAGHAGTLDPNVTGVLLIALNRATKLMPLFERLDKEYEGVAHLHKEVSLKKLKTTIKNKFLGKIKQLPPKKSRVRRQERERTIHKFEILRKQDKDLVFRVRCEAGTYIRKLIHDLGEELKAGAHMTLLRRTKQGPFSIKHAVKIEKLTKNSIIPAEKFILEVSPIIYIKKEAVKKLKQGKFLDKEDIKKIKDKFVKEKIVAAFYNNEVVALVRPFYDSEKIKKQKGKILKPERII